LRRPGAAVLLQVPLPRRGTDAATNDDCENFENIHNGGAIVPHLNESHINDG
jgi:hypothetical protein